MLKLEDATKEELVWWIKENAFSLRLDEQRFSNDVSFRRAEKATDRALAAGDRYVDLLNEYTALLSPYAGKKIGDIPDIVLNKGAALERKMLAASKERDRAHKEWDRMNKAIDRTLR